MKSQFNEIKGMISSQNDQKFERRLADVERRLYAQEQYSRRECIEIHGFENVENNKVEEAAIDVVNNTGGNYSKSDFHAIHKLKNTNIVILKSVNRRTTLNILKSKKNLKNLNHEQKQKLSDHGLRNKIYINESLCPYYRGLFGKCNALFKKNLLKNFYTVNGMIKIIDNQDIKHTIGHNYDLVSLFGQDTLDSLPKKRI